MRLRSLLTISIALVGALAIVGCNASETAETADQSTPKANVQGDHHGHDHGTHGHGADDHGAHAQEMSAQTTCPVMGGAINKKLYAEVNGKRVYVCCEGCISQIENNPEKYLNKLREMGQKAEAI